MQFSINQEVYLCRKIYDEETKEQQLFAVR